MASDKLQRSALAQCIGGIGLDASLRRNDAVERHGVACREWKPNLSCSCAQVTIHTDTLNESCSLEGSVAAFKGRTIHTYHSEGAGGGHAPDIIAVCGEENVIPSSTNPTRYVLEYVPSLFCGVGFPIKVSLLRGSVSS